MPKYVVNTDELRAAAKQLRAKAEEMRAAVNNVESKMSAVRAESQSPRVTQDIQNWESIKTSLMKMFGESEQAAQIIDRTATDIDTVNRA